MDPSKEECHSSESGWTMYLGSPSSYGDENGSNAEGDDGEDQSTSASHGHEHQTNDNGDDDSMASDASSGPSNMLQHLARGGRVRHDEIPMVHITHSEDEDGEEDAFNCTTGLSEKKQKNKNRAKSQRVLPKKTTAAAAAAGDEIMRQEEKDGEENSNNGGDGNKVRINSLT